MVIAVAGRRIDAAGTTLPRFPLQSVPLVERRLDELFAREAATALVASAACGADLIAMTVAGIRKMRRRVVLPFDRDRFRASSVTDRPGDWGTTYDQILAELDQTGDIVTLEGHTVGDPAYAAASDTILDEAAKLAQRRDTNVIAVLVWEGGRRADRDMTAAFGEEARRRGWRVEQVKTL